MHPLAAHVALRIGQALLVLWITFTVVFLAVAALPSDPVTIFLASDAGGDPALIETVSRFYGYDRPLFEQYLIQLGNVVRGDFGFSLSTGQTVLDRIGGVVGQTVALATTALVLSIVFAIAVSFAAFRVPSGWLRSAIAGIPSFTSAIPTFWVGLVALQVLSIQLGVLSLFPDGSLLSLLVPAAVLAIPVSAPIAQVLLKSVQSASDLGFVQTARSKGAGPGRVFFSHVFRASLAPALTVVGLSIGILIAGSVITETVFARPGLGSVLLKAVISQDIPLVQGLVFLTTAVVVAVNLLVDLAHPLLDPRVLASGRGKGLVRLGS